LRRKGRREVEFRAVAEEGSRPDRRFVGVPVQESDIPPGSALSDATLESIRRGEMTLLFSKPAIFPEQAPPPNIRPRLTYQEKLRQRHRAKQPTGVDKRATARQERFTEARRRVEHDD